jgi:hypothetical protein
MGNSMSVTHTHSNSEGVNGQWLKDRSTLLHRHLLYRKVFAQLAMWRTCGLKTSIVRNRAVASARAIERCEGLRPFTGVKRLPSDVKHCQRSARLFSSRTGPSIEARREKQLKTGNSRNNVSSTSAKQTKQQPLKPDRNYDKVVLRELVASLQSLQQRCDGLEDLPPIWVNNLPALDERRQERFHRTRQVIGQIREHVKDGTLRPSGKHRLELTVLFERILKNYSDSLSTDDVSVFEECTVVLNMMNEWKLELQHKHCEYAILAAGREERWKDAADLFWSHIDPEDSGYIPFDVDVSNPVGLYAIARFAQVQGTAVVENVFDGVLRMSMVSPTDQKKCKSMTHLRKVLFMISNDTYLTMGFTFEMQIFLLQELLSDALASGKLSSII